MTTTTQYRGYTIITRPDGDLAIHYGNGLVTVEPTLEVAQRVIDDWHNAR